MDNPPSKQGEFVKLKIPPREEFTKDKISDIDNYKELSYPVPQSYSNKNDDVDEQKLQDFPRQEEVENNLLVKQDYDDLLRVAYSLELEAKYNEAIHLYQQAVNIQAERFEAYEKLGDLYLKQENYILAIENYEKKLKLKPQEINTLLNIAKSYYHLDLIDRSIENYKKVLLIDPDNFISNYNLGDIYFDLKDYLKAINLYKKALKKIEKDTYKPIIHYNLANAYKNLNEYSKAINEYEQAISYNENYADAYYNLAITYLEMGTPRDAIETFKIYNSMITSQTEIDQVNTIIKRIENLM